MASSPHKFPHRSNLQSFDLFRAIFVVFSEFFRSAQPLFDVNCGEILCTCVQSKITVVSRRPVRALHQSAIVKKELSLGCEQCFLKVPVANDVEPLLPPQRLAESTARRFVIQASVGTLVRETTGEKYLRDGGDGPDRVRGPDLAKDKLGWMFSLTFA